MEYSWMLLGLKKFNIVYYPTQSDIKLLISAVWTGFYFLSWFKRLTVVLLLT